MRKFSKLLLLLVSLLMLFSACVETPQEDIVVGKTKIDEEHVGELVETAGPSSTEDNSPLATQELSMQYRAVRADKYGRYILIGNKSADRNSLSKLLEGELEQ